MPPFWQRKTTWSFRRKNGRKLSFSKVIFRDRLIHPDSESEHFLRMETFPESMAKYKRDYFIQLHKYFINKFCYEITDKICNLYMEDINYSNFDIDTFIKMLETHSNIETEENNGILVTNNLLFYFEKELNFNYLMFTNFEKEVHHANEHSKADLQSPKKAAKSNFSKKGFKRMTEPISRNFSIRNSSVCVENNNMIFFASGKRKTSFQKSIIDNSRLNFTDFLQNERHNFMMGESNEDTNILLFQKKNAHLNNNSLVSFQSKIKHLLNKQSKRDKLCKQSQGLFKNLKPSKIENASSKFNFTFSTNVKNKLTESIIKLSKKKTQPGPKNDYQKPKKKLNIFKSSLKDKPDNASSHRYSSFSKMSLNSMMTENSIFNFNQKNVLDNQSLQDPMVLNHSMIELEITDPIILIIDEVFEFNHFTCNNDYRNIHIHNSEALIKGNDRNIGEYFSGRRKAKTKDQWFGNCLL